MGLFEGLEGFKLTFGKLFDERVTGDYKARSGLNALWNVGKSTAFPYLLYKLFQMAIFKFAEDIFVIFPLARICFHPFQKVRF